MVSDLSATYRAMLAQYIEAGEEAQLEAAYTLGHRCFADGMTILGLLDLHREAATDLLAECSATPERGQVVRTFGFLAEALGTFEMAQRGYREAQERARLEQEKAAREQAIALRLQQDLLPTGVPRVPGFEVAVRYLPGEARSHAGGDWYDVFELDGDRAGFVVGDITGHGVGAAAHMGQLRIAVLAYALAGFEPSDVVIGVDGLMEHLSTQQMATLVYAVADPGREQLTIVNAGHPPPLLVEPDGTVRRVAEGRSRLLGVRPPVQERSQVVTPFPAGSRLVLYTDGLIEPVERAGQDGIALLEALAAETGGTREDLCDLLLGKLAPGGARDDICIVITDLLL